MYGRPVDPLEGALEEPPGRNQSLPGYGEGSAGRPHTSAGQHYLKRIVQPLKHLAQGAADQTLRKSIIGKMVIYVYRNKAFSLV